MMKKRKIFGIGAAILVILIAVVPAVNAISLETKTTKYTYIKDPYEKADFNKILDILEKYEEEISEIDAYIKDYIDTYGYLDNNFELPYGLKEKYETILKEGNVKQPEEQEINKAYIFYPKLKNTLYKIYKFLKLDYKDPYITPTVGGGKTDYKRVWIIPYISYIDQIWLDSTMVFWICKTIGPMGLAAIGIILILSGVGAPIGIAFTIASLITDIGFDQIYEMGKESGIYAEITESFMYDPIPPILTYIGPQ
jgi:hypothetical protein